MLQQDQLLQKQMMIWSGLNRCLPQKDSLDSRETGWQSSPNKTRDEQCNPFQPSQ